MALDTNVFDKLKTYQDYARAEEEFQAKKQLQQAQIDYYGAKSTNALKGGNSPAALQINDEIEKRISEGDFEGAQRIADAAKIYDKGINVYGNQPQPTQMNPMMPALIQQESGGNPNAVSPAGAQGIAQIMPATAAQPGYGVQPLQGMQNGNPATAPVDEQIRFSNDYLNAMQAKNGGDPRLAAASYNAGPGRVDAALANLPEETRNYVAKVATRPGYDEALALREGKKQTAKTQAEYDIKKVEEPRLKFNTTMADKNATQVGKNDDALGNLNNMTFGIQEARNLLPKVSMTGPILGRVGAAAEDPDYRNLQGALNSVVLQAKDLYNLGSGQGFTDADRNFLQEVIAGKYSRSETIGLALDRMDRALANRQKFLTEQSQKIGEKYGNNAQPQITPKSKDFDETLFNARAAIRQGANPEKVKQKLIAAGIDPAGLGN